MHGAQSTFEPDACIPGDDQASSPSRLFPPALMLQATCSNAGKSLLAAALCRLLARRGLRVVPFKAQNMALNAFVTADGREMGRAQALQAMACGLEPDVRMNPVLLKPTSDTGSQLVVMGKAVGHMRALAYMRYKPVLWETVCRAYRSLAAHADVMVLEGAGSPAEINLLRHDIVNMRMARYARATVLLVADIDRGGAFAALVGTLALLPPSDRRRIAGFILNKFRGDVALLTPALEAITRRTGKPFLGIVPMLEHLYLPEEDSVSFKQGQMSGLERDANLEDTSCVDIAVPDLPHISNVSDLDALRAAPGVRVRIVRRAAAWGSPGMVLIPGSRNTVADLRWLRHTGLADCVVDFAHRCLRKGQGVLVGLCGGLQMLGTAIHDPLLLEAGGDEPGLGLLPLETTLQRDKCLRRTAGTADGALVGTNQSVDVYGYEIHHGCSTMETCHTRTSEVLRSLLHDRDGRPLGWGVCDAKGRARVWGTYMHGLFDADAFRHALLDALRREAGLPAVPPAPYHLGSELDRLADAVGNALDMSAVTALLHLV